MKISFIIPPNGFYTGKKNWLWWVYKELIEMGNEVLLNVCAKSCDVIVCMTISQTDVLASFYKQYPHIPIVTYNWDWFSFIDKTKSPWPEFVELMKKSIDVWTPTEYMVDKMIRELGLKHYVIRPCSVLEECMGKPRDEGYVVQASRRDERYKNFTFFERGCEETDIHYVSCHPKKYDRKIYIDILRRCRILVVASTEDANTALSATEAAFFKKPLLLSDIEPHKEEWGECAVYFKNNDLEDFKKKLKDLYSGRIKTDVDEAFNLAINKYTPKAMASSIDSRLRHLLIHEEI